MPGAANTTLPKATLDEGRTVVRAFGGDGGVLSFLFDQQHFGAPHVHLPHSGYTGVRYRPFPFYPKHSLIVLEVSSFRHNDNDFLGHNFAIGSLARDFHIGFDPDYEFN